MTGAQRQPIEHGPEAAANVPAPGAKLMAGPVFT
jgi:hypothetical protein